MGEFREAMYQFREVVILLCGFFALALAPLFIIVACTDWRWFWEDERVRPWVDRLGKRGARILYICFGLILIWCGASLLWNRL